MMGGSSSIGVTGTGPRATFVKGIAENSGTTGEFSTGGEARFRHIFIKHAVRPGSYTGIRG